MPEILAELSTTDIDQTSIQHHLYEGMSHFDPKVRKRYCYLTAHWLKRKEALDEQSHSLLQLLFSNVNDTNVEVAGEAVRAYAWIIQENHRLLQANMINALVEKTTSGIQRNHITYLTNLAFLYNELRKYNNLDPQYKEKIETMIKHLSESKYSNVRKELQH